MRDPRGWSRFVDPGWPFVIAGLVMGAAAVLVPSQNDLSELQEMVARLGDADALLASRLRAHTEFLDEIDRRDEILVRRLAAIQFNVMGEGEEPVLIVRDPPASIADWIDASVVDRLRVPGPVAASTRAKQHGGTGRSSSLLSRLTDGPDRLWIIGGSVFSVFIGVLLGPATASRREDASAEEVAADVADEVTAPERTDAADDGSASFRTCHTPEPPVDTPLHLPIIPTIAIAPALVEMPQPRVNEIEVDVPAVHAAALVEMEPVLSEPCTVDEEPGDPEADCDDDVEDEDAADDEYDEDDEDKDDEEYEYEYVDDDGNVIDGEALDDYEVVADDDAADADVDEAEAEPDEDEDEDDEEYEYEYVDEDEEEPGEDEDEDEDDEEYDEDDYEGDEEDPAPTE